MSPNTPTPKKRGKRKPASDVAKQPITDEDRLPGVVYIGHLPHGFYEDQLKKYFSQFGRVLKVKVSRSQKSGKSKGYAFVKFKYAAVAKTVAETCNNYLFFNKLMKCEFKKLEDVHEDTFHRYKFKQNNKAKRLHNSSKTDAQVTKSLTTATKKQAAKLKKLQEMGINLSLEDIMDVPTIPDPKDSESADTSEEMDVEKPDTAKSKTGKGNNSPKKNKPSTNSTSSKGKRSRKSSEVEGDQDEEVAASSKSKRRKIDQDDVMAESETVQTPTGKKAKKGQSPKVKTSPATKSITPFGKAKTPEKGKTPPAKATKTPPAKATKTPPAKATKTPPAKATKTPPKAQTSSGKGETPSGKTQTPPSKATKTRTKATKTPPLKVKTPPTKVTKTPPLKVKTPPAKATKTPPLKVKGTPNSVKSKKK